MLNLSDSFNMDHPEVDISDLSEDGKKIVRCLTSYFDSLLRSKLRQIDTMETHIRTLETRVQRLEEVVDDAAAYERRDTLIISGNVPRVVAGENCKAIVTNMLRDRVQLVVSDVDISLAHRIGTKSKKQGPDVRRIMFKLVRRDLKNDILNACKSIRPDFYINESLTPNRDKIYFILRKAAKKYPKVIHHCKTFDGNVVVFLQPPMQTRGPSRLQKVTVNTREKLQDFLGRFLSSSLADLEVEWP